MGWALETKEEVVEANLSVRGEAITHGGEVDWAVMLVDLDGVATTEGDVGAAFACEMGEEALAADGAGWVGLSRADLATLARP
ncbi:MAG: hypothetical protein JWQ42_986 [Edaphobacter sp.]|nr:hypothetical protein [Edaphobacter sp.]